MNSGRRNSRSLDVENSTDDFRSRANTRDRRDFHAHSDRDHTRNRDEYSRGGGGSRQSSSNRDARYNGGYHRPVRQQASSSRYDQDDYRDNFKSRDRRDYDKPQREGGSSSRDRTGSSYDDGRGSGSRRYRDTRNNNSRESYNNRGPRDRNNNYNNRHRKQPPSQHRDRQFDASDDDQESSRKRARDDTAEYENEPLEGVTPINERRRMRPTLWDVRPRGYDSVTTEMAKISGFFALPSLPENATSVMRDPIPPPPPASALLGDIASLLPGLSRVAKRVIISGYDLETTTQKHLMDYISKVMLQLRPSTFRKNENFSNAEPSPEIFKAAFFSIDKSHFIVEFNVPEYASALVALDQIPLDSNEPELSTFHVERPEDYVTPHAERVSSYVDEPLPPTFADSPEKCAVTGLAEGLDDKDVCEFLSTFGELCDFYLMEPYGVALFQYKDKDVTDVAIQGLSGQVIADNELKVFRLCHGLEEDPEIPEGKTADLAFFANRAMRYPESRVMQVFNGITVEDAQNDDERQFIIEQFEQECDRYGRVLGVQVPIDKANLRVGGKIFVKFESSEDCTMAVQRLAGRSFSGKTLITAFGSEHSFNLGIL